MTAPRDDLDWDRDRFGGMADYATDAEEEPDTVPYVPEDDDEPGKHRA